MERFHKSLYLYDLVMICSISLLCDIIYVHTVLTNRYKKKIEQKSRFVELWPLSDLETLHKKVQPDVEVTVEPSYILPKPACVAINSNHTVVNNDCSLMVARNLRQELIDYDS